MAYIEKHERITGCFFCEALAQEDSPDNLIVYRGQEAFVIMNRYPYTSGHLMVVPIEHVESLGLLKPVARAEMMELATRATQVLGQVYRPDGFNLGMNIGEAAGAGVADHIHLHVVPRWGGDTNYMTSVAGTRVLPEDLPNTYRKLHEGWAVSKDGG